MNAPVLSVRDLVTQFDTRAGAITAVDGVSLEVGPGEVLGIVGESGSGKTITGFSIMGLIDKPGGIAGGEVLLKGQDLRKLSEPAMARLRGDRIAMIFQDPMMTLNPVLRIDTQMIETIRAHRDVSRSRARDMAAEALALVGIPSPVERLRTYPHEMSGGMRQRVVIAIALMLEPDLIIADEPTTALDVTIQSQILSEMQKLMAQRNTALIWITHDLTVVAGLAHRVAVMYAGRIVETGPVDALLDHPKHPYTRGLISSIPSSVPRGERLVPIKGMTPSLMNLPEGCAFAPRCPRASETCRKARPDRQDLATGRSLRCFHPLEEAS
ncbi:peptide/nickel transport system ATP-binding protein [Mameliella alba]|uniref:ABC transporter ATP-binding protein n=1 Tax=Mameliella alba TaxID=561184 RepID=UPI0008889DDD|nr:ABC transporter ATP-binding protein [Mameliella alba]OWV46558.1 ABC transporter ATP-binding protein [Mameliella alba]PTR37382.1 peptide/nickel transport system ATP-binding protein [Mameliella alba]GGF74349.1 ABC transporter ATP-binding protein [Mameliella alba]SDD73727.1 peptide/nickel transport system ATP-binding protein [Mameliella alba]